MPTKDQKAKKAKLPSLEHRYEYRMKRLSTPEGIALEALAGDKRMIATLADVGACIMHDHWASRGDGNSNYAFWLARILEDIARGVEPNEAFGWSNKQGRWKLHNGEELEHLEKSYRVARTVEFFVCNVIGKTFEDAVKFAAEVWRVPESQCRDAMELTRKGLKKLKLGKGNAEALALDTIATFGACGYDPIPHSTARGYYDDLEKTRGNEEKPLPVGSE